MRYLINPKFLAASLSLVLLFSGCLPASTPASVEPLQTSAASQPITAPAADLPLPTEAPLTLTEAEALAGFDVWEPAYLPAGVSFDYAVYQESPNPAVILHFKLVHETFGDLGAFFQIRQEPQAGALPNPDACGPSGNDCETIELGSLSVKYRLNNPTESLMWEADGFSFLLLRTSGEPGKIYKDELLKFVEGMK